MRKLSTVIFIVTLTIVASAQKPLPADLILHNGVIYTVDSKNSIAQAVAINVFVQFV